MRITRIEIFGFKSFMERLLLPLEGGITGVVGPNGCGKSNIVDALRWVLGETRASSLRGELLEDIIFNGTDKLRPLGLAEVTLTLRANGADFFADLVDSFNEEVEFLESDAPVEVVVREAAPETAEHADGQPDEQANEQTAERPKLTVISGRLGSEDDASSEENAEQPADLEQEPVEEIVARVDSPETKEQKEKAAQTFFTRFSWLKTVNEVQVTRRIYRSGESEFFINRTACRLKDLKEFFRAAGLGARAHTIVAQGEVSRIISARPEERRLVLEEAAGVLGFRDKISAANRRLEDTGINISRIDDIVKEVSKQVAVLKKQAARARNRQELKERISSLDREIYRDSMSGLSERMRVTQEAASGARMREQGVEARLQEVQALEQQLRSELLSSDILGDELRLKIDSIKEEISNRERQRAERLARVNELKALALSRGAEVDRLVERKGLLSQREQGSEEERSALAAEEVALTEKIQALEVDSESELRAASAALERVRAEHKEQEARLQALREKIVSVRSALDTIEQQLIAASPLNQLRKTLGGQGDTPLIAALGEARLFADGLRIEPRFAKAAQAVLAERAEFLIASDPHQVGKLFVEGLATTPGMSIDGQGLGVVRSGPLDAAAVPAVEMPSTLSRLLDHIHVADTCMAAAEHLLGRVYVSETLAEALEFFQTGTAARDITIVTLSGEIVTADSFYTLRHEGGLIQLKDRALALQQEDVTLGQEQIECEDALAQKSNELRMAEQAQRDALSRSQERQVEARELSNQLGNVRGRQHAAQRLLEQLAQDRERTGVQIQEAERSIEEFQREQEAILGSLEELQPQEEARLREELHNLHVEQAGIDGRRSDGRNRLSELHGQVEGVRAELDASRADVSSTALEIQKLDLEGANLRDRILNEYGESFFAEISANVGAALLDATVVAEYREEVARLRARIQREGDVDPASIELYEQENNRLNDLSAQREDLERAASILRKTIERLTETSRRRFLHTFEAVRRNFSRLVPRLFGGGKADLELTDPSRPLECGVEIIAKPPGKKLKSIDLLSGGEKALCATALIFSMFLERPSPLCVLDEVDAPLDDANLVRFLSLVQEMSSRTQFLIITHNKHTMAQAQNLVGVTMQQPGASTLLTVSLQEAYGQVA